MDSLVAWLLAAEAEREPGSRRTHRSGRYLVVSETYTWFRYHLSYGLAVEFLDVIKDSVASDWLKVLYPDAAIDNKAQSILRRYKDQDLSYVDADVQPKLPDIDVQPEKISIIMISEATPASPGDYYYAGGGSFFARTTVQAFNDAGAKVTSIRDVVGLGVYLTTAVKCGKTGYSLKTSTIKECSLLLEKELALFPNLQVLMLMGDVAIKALNCIARRMGEARVVPAISTYKLRDHQFYFQGKRVFPSYLQAGPSFFIEKSKRKMIAEDISAALQLVS